VLRTSFIYSVVKLTIQPPDLQFADYDIGRSLLT
jgi:hypothetical protein